MNMRRGVLLLASLAFLAVAAACRGGGPTKVSLALDWFPWSNHSGLFVAQEKGYFKDQGLDVDIYTPADPSVVLQTVGAGKDDFGISYQVEVLLARAQGVPVVSVAALVQHPLNSVMTLKESGLTRPRDLAGKTVGYPGIPYNVPMLKTMVEHDGGDFSRVKLVNVGFDLVPALIGRSVDAIVGAYWVHESISAELQGYPVTIMRMEEWGVPDFYELVLVTSEKNLRDRPEVVEKFMKAVQRGYGEAIQDPQRAIDVLLKAKPEVNAAIERPGVKLLAPLWKDSVPRFGWQTQERWRALSDWLKANGQLPPTVDPDKAFTNRFAQE